MIFSEDYDDPYDEFYFGENVIQFFSGPDYDFDVDKPFTPEDIKNIELRPKCMMVRCDKI